MRLLVVDTDGRPLINTTINIASVHPDPAFSSKESNCALIGSDPTRCPEDFLSKLQIVLAYLGTTCLSRLVERINAAFQDPRYHRSIMEEQAIATELTSAMTHISNAYTRVKPYSTAAANALAKLSHELGNTYTRIREGESDPFASLSVDLAPRNTLGGTANIPQPPGLGSTYFRQRPKEHWIQTALRVLSEDGYFSLIELQQSDDKTARQAASEAMRIKDSAEALPISFLESVAQTHDLRTIPPESENRIPCLSMVQKYVDPTSTPGGVDLASPLRADAAPFLPTVSNSMFAALDHKSGPSHASATDYHGMNSHLRRPFPVASAQPGFGTLHNGVMTAGEFPFGAFARRVESCAEPDASITLKRATVTPIGHERVNSLRPNPHPAPKVQHSFGSFPPERWEGALSQDDFSERDLLSTDAGLCLEEDGILTPRPRSSLARTQSPLFEISSPDSPTYRTWAQKAAEVNEEDGWETVEKGKKAAAPMSARQENVVPAVVSHKNPRFVVITGCRTNTSMSDITSLVDTGPLVSASLEKDGQDGSVTARLLFAYGSNALDFLSNDRYSRQTHGESVYGPGVNVSLGSGYDGPASELRGMFVPLAQAGRSDAGAHFERRRLTFSGNGMALTESKMRQAITKVAGVSPVEIEVIIVFNPGNATAVMANIFAARKVKESLGGRKRGEWSHCKIMYSSDPCEKHLSFMDKVRREKQADRAEVVRRAYQRAGKVTC